MQTKHVYITTFMICVFTLIGAGVPIWLSQHSPDLKYSLADPIPLKFGGKEAESVQQLIVANRGSVASKGIHIKLPPRISESQLDQAYATDKPEIVKAKDSFEIIYPELASQSQFKLIFKTNSGWVMASEVDIRDSVGRATNALLDVSTLWNLLRYLPWVTVLFIILPLLYTIYDSACSVWERRAERREDWILVLKREKPTWVFNERWNAIRRSAISNAKESRTTKVSDSICYTLLSGGQPSFLNDEEWRRLKPTLQDEFVDLIGSKMKFAVNLSTINELLSIDHPQQLDSGKWRQINVELTEASIQMQMRDIGYGSGKSVRDKISKILSEPNPKGVEPVSYAEWKEGLKTRYERSIRNEIESDDNPVEKLEAIDLSMLSAEQKERLNAFARRSALIKYQHSFSYTDSKRFLELAKPKWMDEREYKVYHQIASSVVNVSNREKQISKVESQLRLLAGGGRISRDGHEDIPKSEWERLVELDEGIGKTSEKNRSERIELDNEIAGAYALKKKLLRQLDILNKLLEDPDSVLRIEDYDNPFAIGNFRVLLKIASYIKEFRKSAEFAEK